MSALENFEINIICEAEYVEKHHSSLFMITYAVSSEIRTNVSFGHENTVKILLNLTILNSVVK